MLSRTSSISRNDRYYAQPVLFPFLVCEPVDDVTEIPTSGIVILTSADAFLSGNAKHLGEHNIARQLRDCSSLKLMHR